MAVLNHLDELLVDSRVLGQFRMKGRSHDFSLPYQHRIAAVGSQYLNAFPGAYDLRRADEYHLQRFVSQFALGLANGTVNLPAISIAPDTNVHCLQGLL